MKNRIWVYPLIILGIVVTFINSCKKDTTTEQIPTLTTLNVNNITQTTASCGGYITSDNGLIVTEKGVCWNTYQSPTIADNKTIDGTETGTFISAITGLNPNTTYYVRAYAINSAGTGYGNTMSFTTLPVSGETMTDIEGNIYHIETIGIQTWIVENLKVTQYRDGSSIPFDSVWTDDTIPGYCWYDNNQATYGNIYGALYNWYAINADNLCPTGWHVPTDADWTTLINYLGGESIAGGKLKETGIIHWNSPNYGATNEVGFTALPGGHRSYNNYESIGTYGYWGSSTSNSSYNFSRCMSDTGTSVYIGYTGRSTSISVRCIKD